MKTNFTHILIIRIILFILICLYSILVFGQSGNASKSIVDKIDSGSLQTTIHKDEVAVLKNELSGTVSDGKVKLSWSFEANNNISTVVLEKGHTSDSFRDCAMFWLNIDGPHKSDFKYTDLRGKKKSVHYRLKIISLNGDVSYSKTIHFSKKNKFEM